MANLLPSPQTSVDDFGTQKISNIWYRYFLTLDKIRTGSLIAGDGVIITGAWPNYIIAADPVIPVIPAVTPTFLTGDITGSGTTSIVTSLANTTVTPGTYTNATVNIDAKGRVISASSGTMSGTGTVTSVSVVTANGVSGSVATSTTTPAITLVLSAITPTSVVASGSITGSNLSGTNSGDQIITLSGDISGIGTGPITTTLPTVNSNVGTFNTLTVNGKGLVTAASNTSYQAPGNYVTALTGDGTASGPGSAALTLATVNSNIGTFNTVVVNGKGLVTSASNASYALTSSVPVASSTTPIVDGTGTIGALTTYARADHIHPTDTSRAPLASPTFTGTPAAPTSAANTNTTQLATTAFVLGQAGTATPLSDASTAVVGTGLRYAREDHVHPTVAGFAIDIVSTSRSITTAESMLLVDTTAGNLTETLPPLSTAYNSTTKRGQIVTIKNIGTNTASLRGALVSGSTEAIESITDPLFQPDLSSSMSSITVRAYATGWFITARV